MFNLKLKDHQLQVKSFIKSNFPWYNRLHTFIQFKETKAAFLVAIQIYTDGSTNKIMYSGKLH